MLQYMQEKCPDKACLSQTPPPSSGCNLSNLTVTHQTRKKQQMLNFRLRLCLLYFVTSINKYRIVGEKFYRPISVKEKLAKKKTLICMIWKICHGNDTNYKKEQKYI